VLEREKGYDFDEFLESLDTIKFEKTDPEEIYKGLVKPLRSTQGMASFLSLLQHLFLARKADPYINEKQFELIDDVVAQIILDGEGLDPDFTNFYGLKIDKIVPAFVDEGKLKAAEREAKEARVKIDFANTEKERLLHEKAEAFCKQPSPPRLGSPCLTFSLSISLYLSLISGSCLQGSFGGHRL